MGGSLRIGITGGIGSGKSFICKLIEQFGFPVYYCDNEAKRLMVADNVVVEGIKKLVGSKAYFQDGTLNKRVLSDFLFSEKENVHKINMIVHPSVKSDFIKWADSQQVKCVFVESAILFESGFDSIVDKKIMIYASEEIRLKRVMERDNMSAESVIKRMNAQMSDETKRALSDYCIYNDGKSDIEVKIKQLLSSIC
jgi:dephospho-CoA kinase